MAIGAEALFSPNDETVVFSSRSTASYRLPAGIQPAPRQGIEGGNQDGSTAELQPLPGREIRSARPTLYLLSDRSTVPPGVCRGRLPAGRRAEQPGAGQAAVGLHSHPFLQEPLLLLRLQQDHHPENPPRRRIPELPQARDRHAGRTVRPVTQADPASPGWRHADLPDQRAARRVDGLPARTLQPGR
ncbi:hypothetical protein D3C81_1324770 [compost metagenome]